VAPEREMIRRISPFAPPVAVAAFVLGTLLDGTDAGWSAAIAIAVVYLNFVAHSSSLALAATISPSVLYAVGLGGFIVRMGVIVAVIALLQQTDWFSILAFIAALIPATIALLAVEMKLLSGRMQADLWADPNARREMTP
jgi:cytochrome c biogenesis factor